MAKYLAPDENDIRVGFWFKERAYIVVPGATPEEGGRIYIDKLPIPIKCDTWVNQYFDSTKGPAVGSHLFRIGGRNLYLTRQQLRVLGEGTISHRVIDYPTKPGRRDGLCQELADLDGSLFYDMSSLICTQFAQEAKEEDETSPSSTSPSSTSPSSTSPSSTSPSPRWSSVINLLATCPASSSCDPCTRVGYKIAASLIKIAALRIFAEPEQSIIELPVNSVDAYNPAARVGKFGMGFFSFLYWLIGHPKRFLDIYSFYQEDDKWCTYRVRIQEVSGVLSFSIKMYPESNIRKSGLLLIMDVTEDEFSYETMDQFERQLDKLYFITGAKIVMPQSVARNPLLVENSKVIGNQSSLNDIIVTITKTYTAVEDYATGIPLRVLFRESLVPSISTKTIKLSETIGGNFAYQNNTRYESPSDIYGFFILVNNVAVYKASNSGLDGAYILDLPPTMRIPVSRDDILLVDEQSVDIFRKALEKLFNEVKSWTLTGYHTVGRRNGLPGLQSYLDTYVGQTTNQLNKDIVQDVRHRFEQENQHYLISTDYARLYQALKSKTFIPSTTAYPSALEETLDRLIPSDDKIWYGKKVVFTDAVNDITAGGLYNYLFISDIYKNSLGSSWIEKITVSYRGTALYPIGTVFGSEGRADHEKYATSYHHVPTFAETFGGKAYDQQLYLAIMAKYESLRTYFKFSVTSTVAMFSAYYQQATLYSDVIGISYTVPYALFDLFSSFKGSSTYGQGQNTLQLMLVEPMDMGTWLMPQKNRNLYTYLEQPPVWKKCLRWTKSHVQLTIASTEESSTTDLYINSRMAPLRMIRDALDNGADDLVFIKGIERCITLSHITLFAGAVFGMKPLSSKHISALSLMIEGLMEKIYAIVWDDTSIRNLYKYMKHHGYTSYRNDPVPYVVSGLREYVSRWYSQVTDTNLPINKDIEDIVVPPGDPTFTISNLVSYLFAYDLGDKQKADDFALKVANYGREREEAKKTQPLQIVEIAINEGTTKPFLEAIMTELTQNSVDAIRELSVKNDEINLQLSISPEKDYLMFSITDFVGMSTKAFVYIGVPFLSTKTPSELVTGEMGSGFFNVYRESDLVRIITKGPDGVFMSTDEPIRDEKSRRVVDVRKTVSKSYFGTKGTIIDVRIPVTSNDQIIDLSTRAFRMASQVLGLINIPITYNSLSVKIEKTFYAKLGSFSDDPKDLLR